MVGSQRVTAVLASFGVLRILDLSATISAGREPPSGLGSSRGRPPSASIGSVSARARRTGLPSGSTGSVGGAAPSSSISTTSGSRSSPRPTVRRTGTTVTTFQRVQATQRFAGREPLNGWIALILAFLLSPALCAYLQSGLNSAWTADASTPRSRVS